MKKGSVADFLVRVVLDESFREMALADPQSALEGFDVSEEEKDILCSRDHRFLGLLGDAVTRREEVAEPSSQVEPSEPVEAAAPKLADVRLVLRLAPQASEGAVSYAASLHPYPHDGEPVRDAATDEQATGGADTAPGEVVWIIHVVPTVVETREAEMVVSYSASIQPLATKPAGDCESDRASAKVLASPPWNHHVESSAAKDAARAVAAAKPDQRYGKLLELVHALQTGDEGG